jgi:hypothetical protein
MIQAHIASKRDKATIEWRRRHAALFHDVVEAELRASLELLKPASVELSTQGLLQAIRETLESLAKKV